MDFLGAMRFIHSANQFGSKLGLDNIRTLLRYLGNPQDKLQFVHIAGTNGKGSTAAFIASVLTCAGYQTGLYTSPYLYAFGERIRVNGAEISREELVACVARVADAVERMLADGLPHPTEFELVTAAAFCHYADTKCDIVVLEVGLGGRLDATNVIATPLVSVITSISLDHMQYLGDTPAQIAYEKCGIIKPGGTTVCYPRQDAAAMAVIREICEQRGNPLVVPDLHAVHISHCGLDGAVFDYAGYRDVRIGLAGRHQVDNCVTAIAALNVLAGQGWQIGEDALYAGLAATRWSGRLEVLSQAPLVVADGAHNADGIRAMLDAVAEFLRDKPITFVMGMLADKAYEEAVRAVAGVAQEIWFTTVDNPRAASAETLCEAGRQWCEHVHVCPSPKEAVGRAMQSCPPGGAVLAVGSLYMLSDIRDGVRAAHM